ncbi:MAG: ATP-dependent helicase [Paenibacillaceae bacterium]|jgi:SNF2 family DNA or RNA helicase|nr:ATP-dependent helicase [Paenibacillaceae bacterium]
MIVTGPYTVHASWMPGGTLFLWGTRRQGGSVDATELKHLLFAWHAASFYGTFIETLEFTGKEGVVLESEDALHYFCDPSELQHASIEWSTEAAPLKAAAPAIREALAAGRVMPDYDKWRQGSLGWKLQLPEELRGMESPLLKTWADTLIEAEVRRRSELQEALAKLTETVPRIMRGDMSADLWLDEEDWLVSIGWKPDTTPFRTCLQLVEPEHDRMWQLAILLQDRQLAERIIACNTEGTPMPGEPLPEEWQPELSRVSRDVERWLHIIPELRDAAEPSRLKRELTADEAWEFLAQGSRQLVEAGTPVFLPSWWERLRRTKPRLRAKLRSSVGTGGSSAFGLSQLMEFDWRLAIGDMELTEEEFRTLIEEKRRLVRFRGRWIQLDPKQMEAISQVMKQVKKKRGLTFRDVLELHLAGEEEEGEGQGGREDEDLDLKLEVELNDHLRQLISRLKEHKGVPMQGPPPGFHGTLRPYQAEGVSWLLFLRQFGLGGCLADDMGLGKTIQWISYLLSVKEQEGQAQPEGEPLPPGLLICPTSVLGNWQKELQRFAPGMKVLLHYGPQRRKGEDFRKAAMEADLVLSSYTLAHLDEKDFGSIFWSSICLDEAQNIKNAYTKQSGAVRRLDGFHRIAMTGTPIENRLTELWSIFDFLNPGYFGTLREFSHRFVQPIERISDQALISQVQRMIRPFLLRRLKKDPAIQLDLPDKDESKVFISLTAEQASLYENYIRDLFERLDRLGPMERRGLILSALTRLKQICNHPELLQKSMRGAAIQWRERSNKLERLLDMVTELRTEGDRCLIFTQFVETGYMLQHVLEQELTEPVLFLHGGTPKHVRDEMVARFQNESLPEAERNGVFLLSLKAGGIGLNLTAANHVFHFDRWWNPAVENQATDRAYRIGQNRHVQVHKFVTLGTLEERIDDMIERKQDLSRQIVGGGEGWITELSTEDLKELFSLRQEWINV